MNRPQALPLVAAGLLAGLLIPTTALADDRCGGVTLQAGSIRLGQPVTEAWLATPEGKDCLTDLVQELERHRLVRAVTVAAIVSDADRVSGKGLASAKAVAAALVAAGFPKGRVFGLAPAPQRTDVPGISLRYVERAPEDVVARIAAAGGQVFLGADDAQLKPAEPGMPVLVNELVKTGPNARATIHLKDGSGIELQPESKIRMPVLQLPAGGDRQVQIEVLAGGITADVRKATQQSRFEASNRVSVASVRGTSFRYFVKEGGGTRIETLEGLVAVSVPSNPGSKPVELPAGRGTMVSAEGKVRAPQRLPESPRVVGPLKGALPKDARFSWHPVTDVVSYRLELARDADFVDDLKVADVQATSLSWPVPLPRGKWFWRVLGVDADGFTGAESKVYAVTVGR
ncbi:MAG: FecR domain-containing protein [Myxococcota bacterium]|nr:FecR domain-containing protein [Myxococcota bacterium]